MKLSRDNLFFVGIMTLLSVHCAPVVSDSTQKVYGGGDVVASSSEIFKSTGAVLQLSQNSSNPVSSFCSGVLIAKDVFLTAAHCFVQPVSSSQSFEVKLGIKNSANRFVIGFGPDVNKATTKYYSIQKIYIPERHNQQYDNADVDNYDIAIVLLKNEVSSANAAMPILSDSSVYNSIVSQKNLQSGRLVIAGYGLERDSERLSRINGENTSVFALNSAETPFQGILKALTVQVTEYRQKKKSLTLVGARDASSGACFGDSGGPLFYNSGNSYRIVGISTGGKYSSDSMSCTGQSYYTDIVNSDYLNWIYQTAQYIKKVSRVLAGTVELSFNDGIYSNSGEPTRDSCRANNPDDCWIDVNAEASSVKTPVNNPTNNSSSNSIKTSPIPTPISTSGAQPSLSSSSVSAAFVANLLDARNLEVQGNVRYCVKMTSAQKCTVWKGDSGSVEKNIDCSFLTSPDTKTMQLRCGGGTTFCAGQNVISTVTLSKTLTGAEPKNYTTMFSQSSSTK